MNARDKDRDLLWIRAITTAGIDTTQLYEILKRFNRIRPDKVKKVRSFHGETPFQAKDLVEPLS